MLNLLINKIPQEINFCSLNYQDKQKANFSVTLPVLKSDKFVKTTKANLPAFTGNKIVKLSTNASEFDDLKRDLNNLKFWSEEEVKQNFGISSTALQGLFIDRLKKLLPLLKAENAQYISKNKIGSSPVIHKKTGKITDAEFTKEKEGFFTAYIDSMKAGQLVLTVEKSYPNNSIYIAYMDSLYNKSYKGLGTRLHQLAVETSIEKGFGGKVTLGASDPGAKLFHYKCGFRKIGEDSEEFSKQMEDVIAGRKPFSSIDDEVVNMYLPDDQIQRIIETQIKKAPILSA